MAPDDWQHLPLTDLSYQILLALAARPRHGYGILQVISDRTGGHLQPDTGTLYTAIRRLRREGMLEPSGRPPGGRRGREYRLTPLGRRVVRLESARLAQLVAEADRLRVLPGRPGVPRHA